MVKRRSFEDGLTADEETFLKQGKAKPPAAASKPKSPSKPEPKEKDSDMSKPALKHDLPEAPVPTPILQRPAAPVAPSNLSVRIDSSIAAATLRAMTERKIQGAATSTQQEIVSEALVDWLKKHGYFR